VVSTRLIDALAKRLGRRSTKCRWASSGSWTAWSTALSASSARKRRRTFLRRDGSVWTTDKDGITAALLAGEITARTGRDPGALYAELANEFGSRSRTASMRPPAVRQKKQLSALSPQQLHATSWPASRSRAC
jgi:phosphoglucomutase